MKTFLVLMIFSISASVSAISTHRLVKACLPVGATKLVRGAQKYQIQFDLKTLRVCALNNQRENSLKYVWFCGESTDRSKTFKVLTRKPIFGDCF